MSRGPYLSEDEARDLYDRVSNGEVTIAELARQTGRDKSALYRLFNRRFGYVAGHATGYAWSSTLALPDDPAKIGYIAGIIDGEGTILLSRKGYWSVRVAMTDKPVMDWLCSLGGTRSHNPAPPGGRKPTWSWQVSRRRDVVALLTALRPHLIVKAARADECLADLAATATDG